MKKSFAVLAGAVALLAAPLAVPSVALAQGHGGHGGGHAEGGYRGGGYRGGGFGGGYRGGGYERGGRGYGYGSALGLGLGLSLGLGLAPSYGGYDYYPEVAYAPAYAPAYTYAQPCGQWLWNARAARYDWVVGAC